MRDRRENSVIGARWSPTLQPVEAGTRAGSPKLPRRLLLDRCRAGQLARQNPVSRGPQQQPAVDHPGSGDVAGGDGDGEGLELAGLAVEEADGVAADHHGGETLVAGGQEAGALRGQLGPVAVGAGAGEGAAGTPKQELPLQRLQPAAGEGRRNGVVGVRSNPVESLGVGHPQRVAVEGGRAGSALLERPAGEKLAVEFEESIRSSRQEAWPLGDELLDRAGAEVAHPVPALAAALKKPLFRGGEDAALVDGEV